MLSKKYKKEKNNILELEEKTFKIISNDMKIIDNLENRIKKLNQRNNKKNYSKEFDKLLNINI